MNDIPKLVWTCDDEEKDWGENTDSDAHRRWFVEHYIVQTLFISSYLVATEKNLVVLISSEHLNLASSFFFEYS